MDFRWEIFIESLPFLLSGSLVTIKVAIWAMIGSIIFGLVIALTRISNFRILNTMSFLYVQLMRGTPLLVLLTVIYYGLPRIGLRLDPFVAGVLGLSMCDGAYMGEIFRSGIQSIHKGQIEAAKALGVPSRKIMQYIILPQAMRVIIPPMTSESVIILKNASLLSVIAISELMQTGLNIIAWKANVFTPLVGVTVFYLLMTLPLIYLSDKLEKKMGAHNK